VLQQELLVRVIHALNAAGIEYMITGSIVSSLQGEPRSTHDVDIVVAIEEKGIQELVTRLSSPYFYLDQDSMLQAIRDKTMFSLIDTQSSLKIDFWILTKSPFDQSRFGRKITEDLFGAKINFSAPEDTILMKLHWAEISGGSEKQFTDALRVFEVQKEHLDLNYLEKWAAKLGITEIWNRLKLEAEI